MCRDSLYSCSQDADGGLAVSYRARRAEVNLRGPTGPALRVSNPTKIAYPNPAGLS